MKKILFLIVALTMPFAAVAAQAERWVVYYGASLPPEKFGSYDVIVFDREYHPSLEPLHQKTLLGYISLGEAENYRRDFDELKSRELFLVTNEAWRDHIIVDIRRPEWKAYIIETLVPQTLEKGFDGVMFDTVDSPVYLELKHPEKYKGMKQAAADIIASVRARYPDIKIMMNRGFDVLPQVADKIDMVMAETVYTDWQPGKKRPVMQSAEERDAIVSVMREAQKISPSLKLYSLDYWPQKEKKKIREIYAAQRSLGFVPYVSTLDLQSIYEEPK